MASVQRPPCSSQDTYTSRFRVDLSLPATLSAIHRSPEFLLPPLPYPPPVRRYSTDGASIDVYAMPPPPVPTHARKRKHDRSPSPAPESSASPPSEGDSEYDPRKMRAAPSGAGGKQRKPQSSSSTPNVKTGPNGRPMSREQLRKANHSLIERRRREKINAALADLRSMVPGLGEENGGKGGEFKLEVSHELVV